LPGAAVGGAYLCGGLNSAVARAWVRWRGKRKGKLCELFLEPLAKIPVPAAPPAKVRRIAELARQVEAGEGVREELESAVVEAYGLTDPEARYLWMQDPG